MEPEIIPDLLAPTADKHTINFRMIGSSLLAYGFNILWCTALNGREKYGWDRFAMHHADISAGPFWLDQLLEEQDRVGADVLSAVVPLKDSRGLTSTGLLNPNTAQVQRFTMKEIYDLPVTFTAEDLQTTKTLAINTGLWVCDFSKPWVEKALFSVVDWIAKDADGNFEARALSEDWYFSQWCAKEGLKVAATRIVPVDHKGQVRFSNSYVWGEWEKDQADKNPAVEQYAQAAA